MVHARGPSTSKRYNVSVNLGASRVRFQRLLPRMQGGLQVERRDWTNRLVPGRGESVTVGRRVDQCKRSRRYTQADGDDRGRSGGACGC